MIHRAWTIVETIKYLGEVSRGECLMIEGCSGYYVTSVLKGSIALKDIKRNTNIMSRWGAKGLYREIMCTPKKYNQ